jgi:tetratricopeptide (TPR) repeat protein
MLAVPARTSRLLRVGCALSVVLGLHACSGVQSRALIDHRPEDLPASAEIAEVPFFPQTQHQCGPAALATVLSYHGDNTSPEQLSSQVYLPEREGSLQIEIAAAARGHDMLAYPLRPQLHDLLAEVAAGNPVLILQNNGFNWAPQWHYAVVIGYDFSRQEIALHSGTIKRRLTAFDTFETTWKRSGYWARVILPAGRVPETAELTDYLKAAYALEETSRGQAALRAYRAGAVTWPSAYTAWLALGNMAYQLHLSEESVDAFIHASGIEPDDALVWNNLAYALHDAGCGIEARTAIVCASRLAPDDANIRNSVLDIFSSPATDAAVNCPALSCKPVSAEHPG